MWHKVPPLRVQRTEYIPADDPSERIVAKRARYTPDATTWVKIKNPEYSQAVGREGFFDRRRARA
jgi:hypothetical protein